MASKVSNMGLCCLRTKGSLLCLRQFLVWSERANQIVALGIKGFDVFQTGVLGRLRSGFKYGNVASKKFYILSIGFCYFAHGLLKVKYKVGINARKRLGFHGE